MTQITPADNCYPDGPPPNFPDHYHISVHGGLGDLVWLYKRLSSAPLPLFVNISLENRTRPRRAGILAAHLPRVLGWKFSDSTFAPGGEDWFTYDAPACCIGKKFSEIGIEPNKPFLIECNRWLEGGRRIEDWLPDLPTTHHFEFKPCGPPTLDLVKPIIVLHLAGWPDVPDGIWLNAINIFRPLAHVYIVGGSYDYRPRHIFQLTHRGGGVHLVEDTSWENIMGLLKSCDYCFGHASGFTAIADVLKVKGAIFNPRSVPRLIGTWNSLENPDLLYVNKLDDFESAIYHAYLTLDKGDKSTWPPSSARGPRISGDPKDAAAAARSAGSLGPRTISVWEAGVGAPMSIPAAVLDGAYNSGKIVNKLHIVGFPAESLAEAYRESMRSTARPLIEIVNPPWPGDIGHETFDLVILHTPVQPDAAAHCVRMAWSRLSSCGTLLVGGPAAAAAVESLGSSLRTKPAAVDGAFNWWYLHRRL